MPAFEMSARSHLRLGAALVGALGFGAAISAWAASDAPTSRAVVKVPAKPAASASKTTPKADVAKPVQAAAKAEAAQDEAAPVANGYLCITNSCSTEVMLSRQAQERAAEEALSEEIETAVASAVQRITARVLSLSFDGGVPGAENDVVLTPVVDEQEAE